MLAVDISYSMDFDELKLQRDGYVEALTSREFLNALKQGMHGKVAVTMVEWAGANEQRIVVPWRLIDGPASAQAVAAELAAAPVRRAFRTSISGALLFSAPLFEGNGFTGIRRVIDVSGDGTNNQGPLVHLTRDEVLAKGIIINGLPIMLKEPQPGSVDLKDLDIYFEDCVIGGPGAFVIPIREREKFKEAIRTKLVLDIADRSSEPRVIPAVGARTRASPAPSASRCGSAAGAAAGSIGRLAGARHSAYDVAWIRSRESVRRRSPHAPSMAELIDRRDGGQPVAAVDQDARVAREGRGIARHRDHQRDL